MTSIFVHMGCYSKLDEAKCCRTFVPFPTYKPFPTQLLSEDVS